MWFRYPQGISSVNVEQQEFGVEHKDREGNEYFRAPESLAKALLVVPGFAVVGRPTDAPADLKDDTPAEKADPLAQLSSQVETMRTENEALKKGVADLTHERDALKSQLEAMSREFTRLGGKPEDIPKGGTHAPSGTTPAQGTAPASSASQSGSQGQEKPTSAGEKK